MGRSIIAEVERRYKANGQRANLLYATDNPTYNAEELRIRNEAIEAELNAPVFPEPDLNAKKGVVSKLRVRR